jgi:hypothetical protein
VGVFLLVANRFVKATPLKEENQES